MTKPARPSWPRYFLDIAATVATRSPCVKRQVGAVLVSEDRQILATGYNGPPRGAPVRTETTCVRIGIPSGERTDVVCCAHAEINAIAQAARHGVSVKGATLYVTTSPCAWCARSIINAGVVHVVSATEYNDEVATSVFRESGVTTETYQTLPASPSDDDARWVLASLLDRIGGDGVHLMQNKASPASCSDAIVEHIEHLEERARAGVAVNVVRKLERGERYILDVKIQGDHKADIVRQLQRAIHDMGIDGVVVVGADEIRCDPCPELLTQGDVNETLRILKAHKGESIMDAARRVMSTTMPRPVEVAPHIFQYDTNLFVWMDETGDVGGGETTLEAAKAAITRYARELENGPDAELATAASDTVDPAYWRGNDAGVIGTVQAIARIIDGPLTVEPSFGSPELNALAGRIIAIRTELDAVHSDLGVEVEARGHLKAELDRIKVEVQRALEAAGSPLPADEPFAQGNIPFAIHRLAGATSTLQSAIDPTDLAAACDQLTRTLDEAGLPDCGAAVIAIRDALLPDVPKPPRETHTAGDFRNAGRRSPAEVMLARQLGEALEQAKRDAERADKNAAELGKLRAEVGALNDSLGVVDLVQIKPLVDNRTNEIQAVRSEAQHAIRVAEEEAARLRADRNRVMSQLGRFVAEVDVAIGGGGVRAPEFVLSALASEMKRLNELNAAVANLEAWVDGKATLVDGRIGKAVLRYAKEHEDRVWGRVADFLRRVAGLNPFGSVENAAIRDEAKRILDSAPPMPPAA